jgi:hypothetical protein
MRRRTAWGLALAIAGILVPAVPVTAEAQIYVGREAPHRGSIEVGGGGTFLPGFEMGGRTAELTTSAATGRFELFTTESRVSGFPGASARVAYYLSSAVSIEGMVRYARPQISVRLDGDAESASPVTATEAASHYVFGGSLVLDLRQAAFAGGRAVPFLSGGAGHLRELHEGNQLVETGTEFHGTAGLKYWLGSGDRRFGVRVEAGFSGREKGFDDEEGRRLLPMVLGGVSYLF